MRWMIIYVLANSFSLLLGGRFSKCIHLFDIHVNSGVCFILNWICFRPANCFGFWVIIHPIWRYVNAFIDRNGFARSLFKFNKFSSVTYVQPNQVALTFPWLVYSLLLFNVGAVHFIHLSFLIWIDLNAFALQMLLAVWKEFFFALVDFSFFTVSERFAWLSLHKHYYRHFMAATNLSQQQFVCMFISSLKFSVNFFSLSKHRVVSLFLFIFT